jgi:hypothetical protein
LTGSALAQAANGNDVEYYCGYLVPAKTRCGSSAGPYWVWGNRATYPGTGTVSVCEVVEAFSGGTTYHLSRRCANGTVASGSDLPLTASYPNQYGFVGNNDDGQHTVDGKVRY